VSDLEPLIQEELDRIEAWEADSAGLPAPLLIEGSAGGGPLIIADLIIDYTYSLIKLVLLDDRLQFHVCLLYFRYTAHLLVPWY
jgi:hypothetical protein